jgi:dynein intermediate chain
MAERRRQEIEEKKAKLAELRRARDERKALLAQAEAAGPSLSVQQVSCSWSPTPRRY